MRLHIKSFIIAVVVAVGVWCVLWNPIEYMDNHFGDQGLTIIGIIILFFAWIFWHKKGF